MSVKNFRFVSPGVFVNEIDNSQLPAQPVGIGPVIIGRAEKGPALRPTRVNSFSEFVQVFGTPSPGDAGNDIWRQGNNTAAPTYGMYAAQAYLRNSSPLTYIRLLGAQAGEATGNGLAGWTQTNAWGLYIFETGSGLVPHLTGALGAILYTNSDTPQVGLSGTWATASAADGGFLPPNMPNPVASSTITVTGSGLLIADTGNAREFVVSIPGYSGSSVSAELKTTVNFDVNSPRYIRKVLNTNPQLLNSAITDAGNRLNYFLGETFDRHVKTNITAGTTFGAILSLQNAKDTLVAGGFQTELQAAQTPWVISCNLGSGASNLFRMHALGQPGDWSNKNIKISIQSVKESISENDDYGTFSVVVRHLSDSDNVVKVIEQFDNCNLNPNSLNYICRKIGDRYLSWSTSEKRFVGVGDYDNRSDYIRVEVNSDVDAGMMNASFLPFGFSGITKWLDNSQAALPDGPELLETDVSGAWVTGSIDGTSRQPGDGGIPEQENLDEGNGWSSNGVISLMVSRSAAQTGPANQGIRATLLNPDPEFRVNATDGNLSNPLDAYFGLQVWATTGGSVFERSTIDLLRPRGGIVGDMFNGASAGVRQTSAQFTLDDVSGSGVWVQNAYSDGTSLTAVNGAVSGVLDAGYDRFTVPMYGGFDGLDIGEMDPFANRLIGSADTTSYEFNTLRRSIDSISDPEVIEMNLASMPGITNEGVTTNLTRVCEDRADALAVIDLPDGYSPRQESTSVARNNNATTIRTAINNLRSRNLNSSYGCCFYPWVRARDTINGAQVWLPPSVAALGTFSSSQRKTQVWFAPAGFNRGGLTEGSAGIPVFDVAHQLRRKDRDDLYSANINPIAKFPAEGIVIFGQKTLQTTPSALDRINVRRLMIFVKKRISQIASTILFDPNVPTTWARFKSQAVPFLEDVQTNFGLTEFKLVLDGTTTTPDLIDRNILYAKIYLKPTRAIEFIAIDFNITRTGASFND